MQITKKETRAVIIIAFLAALVFSFDEWGIDTFNLLLGLKNLTIAFIFCLIIYSCHMVSQKLTGDYYDYKVKFQILSMKRKIKEIRKTFNIPIGPIITLLITLISNGKLFFLILNSFTLSSKKMQRLGRKWINIKEFEEAQVALTGPLSQIILLIIFKILSPLSLIFQKGMFIASTIAIFNMLPLPKVDGSKIFFGSRPLYLTSLIFIVVFIVLIFHLSILQTLILALIFSLVLGTIYLFKSNQ